jgi:glucose-1-phosphate adenylyltransferase
MDSSTGIDQRKRFMDARLSTTPVFILAGGVGERLGPLTKTKPKPAVSFGGNHQILDFTLSNCIHSGFRKIFVLTQYQGDHLRDYVLGIRERVSHHFRWHEGDQLVSLSPVSGKRYRGTADAVFQNLQLIRCTTAEHVVVASGDHVYAMDYRPLLARHLATNADLTIGAVQRPVIEASAFGVLDVEDGMVARFREKPAPESLPQAGRVLVSMGVYVFKRTALIDIADHAASTETDLGRDIVPKIVSGRRVGAYDFSNSPRNYWRDVGSLDSYFNANMDLLGPSPAFEPEMDSQCPIYSLSDSSLLRTGGARISTKAATNGATILRSVVSDGASIERGAVVEDSVILPGARVGKNARVRHAIVAEGACIPDGAVVGMDVDLDRTRFAVTPGGVVVVGGTEHPIFKAVVASARTEPVAACMD